MTNDTGREIHHFYNARQNCFDDLVILRKAWGHLSFAIEQAGHAYKALNVMRVECPDEIQYIVDATLEELERRCQLMDMPHYKQHYHLQNQEQA